MEREFQKKELIEASELVRLQNFVGTHSWGRDCSCDEFPPFERAAFFFTESFDWLSR